MPETRTSCSSSASQDILCGACTRPISDIDTKIQCAKCKDQYHKPCSRVSASVADSLKLGVAIRFYCPQCDPTIDSELSALVSLQQRFSAFEAKQTRLESLMVNLTTKIDALTQAQAADTGTPPPPPSQRNDAPNQTLGNSDAATEVMKELDDRNRRKRNLIVSKIAESTSAAATDRKSHDLAQFITLCSEIGKQISGDDIVTLFRLGDKDATKPRLLKVVFKNEESRNEIVKVALSLRSLKKESAFSNCYINPDRTKMEMQNRKRARAPRAPAPVTQQPSGTVPDSQQRPSGDQ